MPAMFSDKNANNKETVFLKLIKSLYGLVQVPCTWYQHLQKGLKSIEFEPYNLDKEMYYRWGTIVITYVDDCLFFGPDIKGIKKAIMELYDNGYNFTRGYGDKDNVFSFLVVRIEPDKELNMLVLTQTGIINKILETFGMSDCNTEGYPTKVTPLGIDANGPHWKERWNYASVIWMIMYLSSKAHPGIKFAVHQCNRFSHIPWERNEEVINHICR